MESSNRGVFIGWAIGLSNHELGLDVFGSMKEVVDSLKARGQRFSDVAKHLATEITRTEVFAEATVIPKVTDVPGLGPVVEGVLEGDGEKVRQALVEHPSLFAAVEGAGIPLAIASFLGRVELVKFLLNQGCPPGQSFRLGMTPLHWAAAAGRREVVEALLDAGAEAHPNWFFLTADHLAFRNGHLELATWLEQRIPDSWKELGFDHIMGLLTSDQESG